MTKYTATVKCSICGNEFVIDTEAVELGRLQASQEMADHEATHEEPVTWFYQVE